MWQAGVPPRRRREYDSEIALVSCFHLAARARAAVGSISPTHAWYTIGGHPGRSTLGTSGMRFGTSRPPPPGEAWVGVMRRGPSQDGPSAARGSGHVPDEEQRVAVRAGNGACLREGNHLAPPAGPHDLHMPGAPDPAQHDLATGLA